MDRFGPTGKVSKKTVHLSRWTTFLGWTGPIEMDRSIWPFPPVLNPRTSLFGIFHVQNGGKYLSLHFYGLLTAEVSVLLVHPCTVTTGLYLLRKQSACFGCWWLLKTIYLLREFRMFFSSFDSNVVFEVAWQISGNGLFKITDPFDTKKFSNLSQEILLEWIAPTVSQK